MQDDALEIIAAEIHSPPDPTESELELLRLISDVPRNFLFDDDDEPAYTRRFLIQARRTKLTSQPPLAIAACGLPAIGTYARLWGPRVQPSAPPSASLRCLQAVANLLANTAATHILTVLDNNNPPSGDRFREFGYLELGYTKLTDVLHLVYVAPNLATVTPPTDADSWLRPQLVLSKVDDTLFERFLVLLQATYQRSDDCPKSAEQYSLDEVKSRWRRTPAAWRAVGWQIASIVQDDGPIDVGCLVLDLTAQSDHVELVYMGLIEEQRGKGFGAELVSQAQRILRQSGKNKMIVSVDANNETALSCYLSQGFVCYAESSVLVRPLDK